MDCEPKQTLCILNCFCLATLLEEQETTLTTDCMYEEFFEVCFEISKFHEIYMKK